MDLYNICLLVSLLVNTLAGNTDYQTPIMVVNGSSTARGGIDNPVKESTPSPCSNQFTSGETIVDCTALSITEINSKWFPQNTTRINLIGLKNLYTVRDDVFEHLQKLNNLKVVYVSIGIEAALQMLRPMVGKNMTQINFQRVGFSFTNSYENLATRDGILDLNKTKYLRQICVREFRLIDSGVYVIKLNALYSKVWTDCLRILDLSLNPMIGARIAAIQMVSYKYIEHVYIEDAIKGCYQESAMSQNSDVPVTDISRDIEIVSLMQDNRTENNSDVNSQPSSKRNSKDKVKYQVLSTFHTLSRQGTTCSSSSVSHSNFSGFTIPKLPKSLQSLHIRSTLGSNGLDESYWIQGADNLVYLDISRDGFFNFRGTIIGLEVLKTAIISGNDMSVLSETFFDTFCGLENLYLSSCLLNVDFMSNNSARIFQNLFWLQHLDLSYNLLYAFSQNTFARNGKLEVLNLSTNRFRNIPFNLQFTPNLRVLDLRDNSLTSLGITERENLDNLAEQPDGFQLKLSGNILSCGCNNLPFLQWLRTTHVQLDVVNIKCLNDLGQLVNVGPNTNLMDFWRKCWGSFFLSLAVSLVFIMIIAFLVVFFVWKHRIFIKSFMLKLVTGHKLKEPSDYITGVYIGYADRDYTFPCFVLRKFIEDEVKLSTYLAHRDLDPASDIASSIVHAMNGSWRIILVFSNNFLYSDEWSVFTFRSAMYAQTAENPERVVVLVDENLQHLLPAEVLSSVPDDNIIVMSRWRMTYKIREKLKSRLLQA